ncbi:MAG: hypothetical protein Tsb005_07080 [Gammaproteobacteria bacterium]
MIILFDMKTDKYIFQFGNNSLGTDQNEIENFVFKKSYFPKIQNAESNNKLLAPLNISQAYENSFEVSAKELNTKEIFVALHELLSSLYDFNNYFDDKKVQLRDYQTIIAKIKNADAVSNEEQELLENLANALFTDIINSLNANTSVKHTYWPMDNEKLEKNNIIQFDEKTKRATLNNNNESKPTLNLDMFDPSKSPSTVRKQFRPNFVSYPNLTIFPALSKIKFENTKDNKNEVENLGELAKGINI